MKHIFFEGLKATLHISHRGGAGLHPENTLPAFTAAVNVYRTDMLELDVRLSRDGEVVVWHDETVDRCSDGDGFIARLDWKELSQLDAGFRFSPAQGSGYPFRGHGIHPVRLETLLTTFPTMRFNIELKCKEVLGPFVKLLKKHGALGRLCIGSEDDAVATALFDALPDGCHFYPREALTAFIMTCREGAVPPKDDRFAVLDMPYEWQGVQLFDSFFGFAAERAGKWVNVWTVDDEATMRTLVKAGVGGIMTDRPDTLRDVLGPAATQ